MEQKAFKDKEYGSVYVSLSKELKWDEKLTPEHKRKMYNFMNYNNIIKGNRQQMYLRRDFNKLLVDRFIPKVAEKYPESKEKRLEHMFDQFDKEWRTVLEEE